MARSVATTVLIPGYGARVPGCTGVAHLHAMADTPSDPTTDVSTALETARAAVRDALATAADTHELRDAPPVAGLIESE